MNTAVAQTAGHFVVAAAAVVVVAVVVVAVVVVAVAAVVAVGVLAEAEPVYSADSVGSAGLVAKYTSFAAFETEDPAEYFGAASVLRHF